MDTVTLRPPRRRRTLAIVAVVVLIPVAAHAIWDQIEATRFARYVADLRAKGEPVDLRVRQVPLASDEERKASRLYYAAAMLAADSFPDTHEVAPTGTRIYPRAAVADLERSLANVPGPHTVEEPGMQRLARLVADSEEPTILLDRAAPLRFSAFSPERSEYSYLTNDLINLGAINAVRADIRSLSGNGNGAAEALYAGVRLKRAFTGFGRALWGGTFGSLRLMLGRTAPDDAALAKLQQAYTPFINDDALARDTIERRAWLIGDVWPTTARPFFAQRIGSRGGPRDWPSNSVFFILLRPWTTHRLLAGLHELDAAIALAREPWPQRLQTQEALAPPFPANRRPFTPPSYLAILMARMGVPVWVPPAADLLAPAMHAYARQVAQTRVAAATLAVERWRRAHDGAPPSELQALVPALLDSVPSDPYTGQPLRFIRAADGYTIYSVGEDRTDNHGDIGEWQPDVLGRYPRIVEHDIGIRVPFAIPK